MSIVLQLKAVNVNWMSCYGLNGMPISLYIYQLNFMSVNSKLNCSGSIEHHLRFVYKFNVTNINNFHDTIHQETCFNSL